MEVHSHTHTERKKWTHYLWEFLMLFLAVFCGFIAENIREERVNHSKEKEYIKSMFRDLVSDTAMLNQDIGFATRIGAGLDSLGNSLYYNNGTDSSCLNIYRLHTAYSRAINTDFN